MVELKADYPVFSGFFNRIFSGELRFPEGMIEIPDKRLQVNCSSVIFPSTLKKIGAESFCDTPLTGELVIPEGVLQIGDGAFRGCP